MLTWEAQKALGDQIRDIEKQRKELKKIVDPIHEKLDEYPVDDLAARILEEFSKINYLSDCNTKTLQQISKAANGNIQMKLLYGENQTISATTLTSASAGSSDTKFRYTIKLQDADGNLHRWANFNVAITGSKSNGAAAYNAPTIVWVDDQGTSQPTKDARFVDGLCNLEAQFDCGPSKTYTANEALTGTIDVATVPTPPLYTSPLCANISDLDKIFKIV